MEGAPGQVIDRQQQQQQQVDRYANLRPSIWKLAAAGAAAVLRTRLSGKIFGAPFKKKIIL